MKTRVIQHETQGPGPAAAATPAEAPHPPPPGRARRLIAALAACLRGRRGRTPG